MFGHRKPRKTVARQRFIHPSLWEDPAFGRLSPFEQVLFIGIFSHADDDGRLVADPDNLRSLVFRYHMRTSRTRIVDALTKLEAHFQNVQLYQHGGHSYVVIHGFREWQKPKYPTPSRLPPPPGFPESSGNPPEALGEGSSTGVEGWGVIGRGGVLLGETEEKPSFFRIPKGLLRQIPKEDVA